MSSPSHRLSVREWQVLALLAQGCHNKEIARHLTITPHTVEKHLTHIYEKLGVTGRTAALHWYSSQRQGRNTGNP